MEPIVVRKYGNRRLYDTAASRYINLEELAAMVRRGEEVQVVDAKTGEDLTRLTLTQVIVGDAKDQRAALPLEVLRELIVASNHAGRDFVMWYLKSAFDAYRKLEGTVESSLRPLSPSGLVKSLIGAGDEQNELQQLKQRVADLEKRTRPGKKVNRKRR
ncbi:MAG: polyhydroxyalkanoate synthesis regulator DNA-binding domain-containing protein [Terriglobales bacterium]